MVTQFTAREVSVEDDDVSERQAPARYVNLNTVLRDIVVAECEQIRHQAHMMETIREMDQLRARIAEEAGGYLTDSTRLTRGDRDSR